MRKLFGSLVAVLGIVFFTSMLLFAEGTKQIMPNSNAKAVLCINKWRNDFGFYGASKEFRLNISIANTSEKIRFGFGQVQDGSYSPVSDLVYRIKDSTGAIVYGPFSVPASGKGYIKTYAEAFTGPFAGGYDYLEIQPLITGNYFMEFYYPPSYLDNDRHYLNFFDITVVDAVGSAVEGRVWSKAWQFGTGDDLFYGKMMILSDDSIVTQVNCNGFHGGSFSFSSNMTGCSNTSDLSYNRKSTHGFHTYPQFKVFLNDPDNNLYPTQKATSGIILPVTATANCTTGGSDFGIKVEKDCIIKLLLETNPNPGVDPEDVQIIADLKANPGGDGYNYITWDGNDNFGKPVTNGISLGYTVTNLSGLTHLPIYDIENNANGFIVNQIRPAGGQLKIYWDDSDIGGTSNTSTGCVSSGGCHTWSNGFGDNNTLNSWWFVTGSETAVFTFTTQRIPATLALSGNTVHCIGTVGNLDFFVANDPNSTSYKWSYSGNGVTINESGTSATLSFTANATEGTLSVNGHNESCGDGPVTSIYISFEPLPVVSLSPFQELCYTAPGFKLTGGEPQGGDYFVDNNPNAVDSLFPYKESEGLHRIVYSYTAPTTCSNSDTTEILLYAAADCLGTVYFPTAFTPDGDSLNDVFWPVARNISTFKMYIFNRWGQVVFSTDDATKGWDGTSGGKECPEGTYTFTSTYGLSLRTDNTGTQRGVFALIR